MEKLTSEDPATRSADMVGENIGRLRAAFPEAITEEKVDFEVLKQLLGGAVDEREEKFGLNWHGKRRARQLALMPSTGTLRPCPEDSVDWDTTRNLMIEGDNLEVLKLLQKPYSGEVQLIYIDPPYNTGKDFIYPDNFQDNIKNYLELTGQTDGAGRRLSSNTEASGRFHTDWLNMMYPRLKLARNLLREDGVLFISIDDNEVDNLRLVCDEIFGEENFIVSLFWEKGRKNDAKLFSVGHDYMLVYAKSKGWLSEKKVRWREAKPGAAEIHEEYQRLKAMHGDATDLIQQGLREFYIKLPKTHPSKKLSRYSNVDDRGVWRDDNMSWPGGGGPTYDVPHPKTHQPCKVPEGGWRYSTFEKMKQMIDSGRVLFREDHTEPPIRKTYLVRGEDDDANIDENDEEDVGIQVAGSYFYRSALQASNLMLDLFGAKVFDNPKDHEVLMRWVSYVCGSCKDAIVLDFFAGSGTTGHAVMAQNHADGGSRRYILVQLPERLDPEDKDQKVAAKFCDQINKPRTIAELTKERLRRAGKKIQNENLMFACDIGFRVFKLASSNIRAWEPDRENLAQTLEASVEHLKTDRTEADVLYELLLKLGLDLSVPIEEKALAGKTVRSVGTGTLLVCLAEKIAREDVEPLALGIVDWHKALAPAGESTVVFRDSAFVDDVAKTNLAAILQQHGLENVRSL
jgi:adenine-specific DNA-methyltransferase